MPIVYDPGIAESIRNYSEFFMTPQNAAYLTADHPEEMEEAIRNAAGGRDIELIVVTDAQAILGIGDWGTNGVSISTGKLMVYTAAAGIDPAKVLPVVIDAGTDRQSLLDDPLYLGLHHHRIGDEQYYAYIDQFVELVERHTRSATLSMLPVPVPQSFRRYRNSLSFREPWRMPSPVRQSKKG